MSSTRVRRAAVGARTLITLDALDEKQLGFLADRVARHLEPIIAKLIHDLVYPVLNRPQPVSLLAEQPVLRYGNLALDVLRHEVTLDGALIHLKPREFELLATLMRHSGHVLSREQLLARVWPHDIAGSLDVRTVDVHVRRLRVKLAPAAAGIQTVNGFGYKFTDTAPQ